MRHDQGHEQGAQEGHLRPSSSGRHPVGRVHGHDVRWHQDHLRRLALRDAEAADRREAPGASHPERIPDDAHRGYLASPQWRPQDLVRPRSRVSPTSSVNLIPG